MTMRNISAMRSVCQEGKPDYPSQDIFDIRNSAQDNELGCAGIFEMATSSKKPQKNFNLGAAHEPFERWCRANGYMPKQVFLAGWLALAQLSHDERIPLMLQAGDLIEGDMTKIPGAGPKSQMDGGRKSGRVAKRGRASGE